MEVLFGVSTIWLRVPLMAMSFVAFLVLCLVRFRAVELTVRVESLVVTWFEQSHDLSSPVYLSQSMYPTVRIAPEGDVSCLAFQ